VLNISRNNILTNLKGLENIRSVGRSITIQNNFSLVSLIQLELINGVNGDLQIFDNHSLTNLEGLHNIAYIKTGLDLATNSALQSLEGLRGITTIGTFISIYSNDALKNFNGLQNIKTIKEEGIYISYNDSITSLVGLQNITAIKGNLVIRYNNNLEQIEDLKNLTTVEGYLSVRYNYILKSLKGLQNITTLRGGAGIGGTNVLDNLNYFPNVPEMSGLSIFNNKALPDLEGLEHITAINGNLYVAGNDSLGNLNALQNVSVFKGNILTIEDNPLLKTCNNTFICDFLMENYDNPDRHPITRNANGCKEIDEILDNCTNAANDQFNTGITVYPNPSTGIFKITFNNTSQKKAVIYLNDAMGKECISPIHLQEDSTLFDFTFLPTGLYYLNFLLDESLLQITFPSVYVSYNMRIICVLLITLLTYTTKAQVDIDAGKILDALSNPTDTAYNEKYNNSNSHYLNVSVGFFNPVKFSFNLANINNVNGNPSPSLNLDYNYAANSTISLGAFANYYRVNAQYTPSIDELGTILGGILECGIEDILSGNCFTNPLNGENSTIKQRLNVLTVGGKLSLHARILPKIDTYAATYLGYSFNKRENIVETVLEEYAADLLNKSEVNVPKFVYYLNAGARIYLNKNIGIYGEFGYGNVHLGKLGLTCRL